MHAESWELDLNSEFRVLTSFISLTLSSTIQNACNNKNDLKVGIDFQCSMNMVPKCRAQFMHDWIPDVLSARTRDCRRRPDLIARAENHNSTQPGCHVASRTRSTDLQKMTWYFRSFPVRGYGKTADCICVHLHAPRAMPGSAEVRTPAPENSSSRSIF